MEALVADHLRFKDVKQMRESTLKRFLRQPHFEELLELHRLDCLASHGWLDNYEFVQSKLSELPPERLKPARLITGDDLIRGRLHARARLPADAPRSARTRNWRAGSTRARRPWRWRKSDSEEGAGLSCGATGIRRLTCSFPPKGVGKPPTFRIAERIRFDGHMEVGARMAVDILTRLRFSSDQIRRVERLVADHLRFKDVKQMRESTLKRFLRQPHFDELLELHRLDCLASHGWLDNYDFVQSKLGELPPERLKPARLISGNDLTESPRTEVVRR